MAEQDADPLSRGTDVREALLCDLLSALEHDPGRKAFEKETRILWHRQIDVCSVYTADPTMAKRLLLHPESKLRWFEAALPERRGTTSYRCDHDERGFSDWNGTDVYSVEVTLPIGSLKLSATPRGSSAHTKIVSGSVLDNDPRKGDGDG